MAISRREFLVCQLGLGAAALLSACAGNQTQGDVAGVTSNEEEVIGSEMVEVDGEVSYTDVTVSVLGDDSVTSEGGAILSFEGCCAKTEGLVYDTVIALDAEQTMHVVSGRYHLHVSPPDGYAEYPVRTVVISNETREEHIASKAAEEGISEADAEAAMEQRDAELVAEYGRESEWVGTRLEIALEPESESRL